MPQRAFIVHLEVDSASPDTIAGIAEGIKEDLIDEGYVVLAVNPWDAPASSPASPIDAQFSNIGRL